MRRDTSMAGVVAKAGLAVLVVLLAAGCGSGSDQDATGSDTAPSTSKATTTTTTAPPTTTSTTTTTAPTTLPPTIPLPPTTAPPPPLEHPCLSLDAIAEEFAGPAGWESACGGGAGLIGYLYPSSIEFVTYSLDGDRWVEGQVLYLDELTPGQLPQALGAEGAALCSSLGFVELEGLC